MCSILACGTLWRRIVWATADMPVVELRRGAPPDLPRCRGESPGNDVHPPLCAALDAAVPDPEDKIVHDVHVAVHVVQVVVLALQTSSPTWRTRPMDWVGEIPESGPDPASRPSRGAAASAALATWHGRCTGLWTAKGHDMKTLRSGEHLRSTRRAAGVCRGSGTFPASRAAVGVEPDRMEGVRRLNAARSAERRPAPARPAAHRTPEEVAAPRLAEERYHDAVTSVRGLQPRRQVGRRWARVGWWLVLGATACHRPSPTESRALLASSTTAITMEAPAAASSVADEPRGPAPSGPVTPDEPLVAAYPLGRWRLVPRRELTRVVLFASHILVRHSEVERTIAPLTLGRWERLAAPPRRSRKQALELATVIERKARSHPERFHDLAATYSEDPVTRSDGGRLGAVRASEFLPFPEILDAFAALEPGQASRVIETEFGFHVFLREEPPSPTELSGRRLVIGYDGAAWLDFARRPGWKRMPRTRAAAYQLAREVADQARRSPEDFDRLVRAHSEHSDAQRGGDIGVWSNQEPTHLTRELLALEQLPLGGISAPIDTYLGFQVVIRDPVRPRTRYAMAAIELGYDPTAPESTPRSRRRVQENAVAIARELRGDPTQFARYQSTYGSSEVEQWSRGRGPVGIADVLDRLEVGETAPTATEVDSAFLIPRRVDPAVLGSPPIPLLELPNPGPLEVLGLLRTGQPGVVARFCREVGRTAGEKLGLRGLRLEQFAAQHAAWADAYEGATGAVQRAEVTESALDELRGLLGHEAYARYQTLLSTRLEAEVLAPAVRG